MKEFFNWPALKSPMALLLSMTMSKVVLMLKLFVCLNAMCLVLKEYLLIAKLPHIQTMHGAL